MSLKNKLNRLKPHISGGVQGVTSKDSPETFRVEIPYLSIWEGENVTPYYINQDYCLIREVKYPLSQKHGNYYFHDY